LSKGSRYTGRNTKLSLEERTGEHDKCIALFTPNINVNTESGQLRTELQNTFIRLDGQLQSVPITLYSTSGAALNTGSGETVLFSNVFDTNTLPVNSDSVAFTISGITAANANAKQIRVYYGGT
jgi:hypothetical protein